MDQREEASAQYYDSVTRQIITYTDYMLDSEHIHSGDGSFLCDFIMQSTSVVAPDFINPKHNPGQQAQDLSDWHSVVKKMCSDRYTNMSNTFPELTRDELRADIELRKLNAVRRGVGAAMRQQYKTAKRK